MTDALHCEECGVLLASASQISAPCGANQQNFKYRSRVAAAAFAVFGGTFGAHRFFLGQWWGIFYLLLFWTYIPSIVGIIEGIVFLSTSQKNWNRKYNQGISVGSESGALVMVLAIFLPVVAIIGFLAAIAILAYHDMSVRAKIAEGIAFATPAKAAVSEYIARHEGLPQDSRDVGIAQDPNSKLVSKITVDKGIIYVEMTPETGAEGVFVLVPSYSNGVVTWSCKESTIKAKYLPAYCR